VKGIQAVRHREGVEEAAHIMEIKSRLPGIDVDVDAALGNLNGPQQEAWRRSRIVRMRAQLARGDAVDSKKRERAFVAFLIGRDEVADDEPRVRVELVE